VSVPAPTPTAHAGRALELRTLPRPRLTGSVSLEEAIARRASVREFAPQPLRIEEISQLLWAAQGITRDWGARSAPSAGALFPLELYLVTPEGLFLYLPDGHRLARLSGHDLRSPLARAALGQDAVEGAPAVVVITAVYSRSRARYGDRAVRFATLEAGHVAENLLLQAVALGLAALPVGAFDAGELTAVLDLPRGHEPVYLVAIGRPAARLGVAGC
jgi:SagB-type dehydrogenase family enzyme